MSPLSVHLLRGIPDDREIMLVPQGWERAPAVFALGNAPLQPPAEFGLDAQPVLFAGGDGEGDGPDLPARPCVNLMADGDVYRRALAQANAFVRRGGLPCFNHPRAVLASARESATRYLNGIEGLHVPKTARVRATRWVHLDEAVARLGLAFPLIARMAGDQGAARTVRLEGPDWEAINHLPWGGRDLYLTEWVDCRDPDGLYRTVRVAIVGEEIFPCIALAGTGWLTRPRDLAEAGSGHEERLAAFSRDALPALRERLMEVAARLRLDCFAIDGNLRPDGRFVLFEANATNPTHVDLRRPALRAAVRRRLADPASWYGQPAFNVP